MATPNTLAISELEISLPTLPSERGPEDFNGRDKVLAVFFSRYMEKPELVNGEVFDTFTATNPRIGDSPGMVHIKTPKTDEIRTGRILGINMASVGLITETALPHLHDENFRELWLADGSEAWAGEREMLAKLLDEGIADGSIGRTIERPGGAQDHPQHPSHALEHRELVPGSYGGKIARTGMRELAADSTY